MWRSVLLIVYILKYLHVRDVSIQWAKKAPEGVKIKKIIIVGGVLSLVLVFYESKNIPSGVSNADL